MDRKPWHRLSLAACVWTLAILSVGCGSTVAPAAGQLMGPEIANPSDGRLGGAWWNHPNGAKLKPAR